MKQFFSQISNGSFLFLYINTLSLDVAVGSMVSASFFGMILGVKSSTCELIGLGLVVWLIYTVDHLLDAVNLDVRAITCRHRFHQRYFYVLFFVVLLVALGALVLVFFMRKPVVIWGSMLLMAIVVYFILQQRLGFLKELSGAILYTVGVLLPSVSLLPSALSISSVALIILFAIIVWINLILFSWLSADRNRSVGQFFPVFCLDRMEGRVVFYGLFMIDIGLSIYCVVTYPGTVSVVLILLMMSLALFIIFICSGWFVKNDRYRIVGDAIFFLPLLQFFYHKN